jgi:DNA-binding XRE family transcriptional regulator
MVYTNTEWVGLTDAGIVAALGKFIRHNRLNQNKTQALLAKAAGLNRWTITQIEKGEPITLLSLIQILRALDQLQVFRAFEVSEEISPLEYARLKKSKRVRASSGSKNTTNQQEDSAW